MARVYVQAIFETNNKLVQFAPGKDFEDLIEQAYSWGARVHTNSWGAKLRADPKKPGYFVQTDYSRQARDVDRAAWNHRDLIILFAAGNNGQKVTDTGAQVGSQAAAKNCVTVGACETSHPLSYDATRVPKYRYEVGQPYGNPDVLAYFSSQGPTKNTLAPQSNSRIKPDVLAPGVCIYSARSTDPNVSFRQHVPPTTPGTPPATIANNWCFEGDPPDDIFHFCSGTSMATPLVAGCCSVIQSTLLQCLHRKEITSALVKAVLINGTVDMSASGKQQRDGSFLQRAPSGEQGFGRVNLEKSLLSLPYRPQIVGGIFPTQSGFAWPQQGETRSIDITIPPMPALMSGSPGSQNKPILTATMCYTDYPGEDRVGNLVNIITMRVEAGVPTEMRYGNTGTAIADTTNNVQKVVGKMFRR